MTDSFDFYFDFSSPYGYFASHRVDEMAEAAGRTAKWRPFMLGPVFKQSGNGPLIEQPLKGPYCIHDWERRGRMMGVDWVLPDPFPIGTVNAARAVYWLDDQDPALARRFAKAVYHTYFGRGIDITPAATVADVAAGEGVDRDAVLAVMADPVWKQRLKDETEHAVELGVCGSPFFIVDGEGFWGSDRLWMVRRWLSGERW